MRIKFYPPLNNKKRGDKRARLRFSHWPVNTQAFDGAIPKYHIWLSAIISLLLPFCKHFFFFFSPLSMLLQPPQLGEWNMLASFMFARCFISAGETSVFFMYLKK